MNLNPIQIYQVLMVDMFKQHSDFDGDSWKILYIQIL